MDLTDMLASITIGWYIGILIYTVTWGVVVRLVMVNKGYEDEGAKWFWLGFFFGFFALIVALVKPRLNNTVEVPLPIQKAMHEKNLLNEGGWKCPCGTVNANYVSTCQCGRRKLDVLEERRKAEQGEKSSENVDQVLKLKQLLDAGVLTQEEFDLKKKDLLNL